MRPSSILGLVPLALLPSYSLAAHPHPDSLTTWEQIHQTLHTYPLAIDLKQRYLFDLVFAPDAFANYTGYLSNLTTLPVIASALQTSVASVLSQHQLGTCLIDITSDTTANSTTYFTATLFGLGKLTGSYVYLYGLYADSLVKLDQGWRISERYLVFMGPNIGNLSLGG